MAKILNICASIMIFNASYSYASNICSEYDYNPSVYIGGSNNLSAYADFNSFEQLFDSHKVAGYISIGAIKRLITSRNDGLNPPGSLQLAEKVADVFSRLPPPIIEENYDRYGTPDISEGHRNDGKSLNDFDGPKVIRDLGINPEIITLNINYSTDKQGEPYFTDENINDFNTAGKDIRKLYPSVSYIVPYIRSDARSDWSHPSQNLSRVESVIKSSGGVALDYPANFLLSSPDRVFSAISEIRWANSNGVKTIFYISPYSSYPIHNNILKQQQYDQNFLKNTQRIVSLLTRNHALPSVWVVGNYSPVRNINGHVVTANVVGKESGGDKNSIAAVGLWMAHNAPTSDVVKLQDNSSRCK